MGHHVKSACLLGAQGDGRAVQANLEGVPAQRPAHEGELGPFDEPQDHQPLNGRVRGVDRLDPGGITGFQVRECQTAAPREARK
jgi:hypothetical protein